MRTPDAIRSAGAMLAMMLTAGASAATLSVGPGKTYAAPCAAIASAKSGDTIEIQGGATYQGDVCTIWTSNLTIRGVNGQPRIDANGKNAGGKGTWVVAGNDITVENVEMLGAKVADKNGAAFRLEGAGFTLRGSYIHDNENGILTTANTNSDVLVEYSEFSHNGHGDGYTHNLYIGHIRSLTFRYNYTHDANGGHNLKSRAITNTVVYNRISSSGLGQPSYELDFPNAGTTYVIGNVIQQPAANQNPAMLAYGEEGAPNPGTDLYVVNNTFLNDSGSGGTFLAIATSIATPALVQNNLFAGVGTVITQAAAIDKTNFRGAAPGFADRANFDLHPSPNAQIVDAGLVPGVSATGVSLVPVAQYKHVASGEARTTLNGKIDIGAYEALPPVTWTLCAGEGGTCKFTGTRQVRYGANGAYTTKAASGQIACNSGVFGDPAHGIVKMCSYANTASSTPAPTPTPAPAPTPSADPAWTFCANEGGTCAFSGTHTVRYGANGLYATKVATGAIVCSNAVFGDPANGVAKSCSYSDR